MTVDLRKRVKLERGRPHGRSKLEAQRRSQDALALYLAGATYDQVAEQLGYSSRAGAHRAIQRLMHRTDQKAADTYRELWNARLERLLRAWWVKALDGNEKAAHMVLKIADRSSKLNGLDAPFKIEGVRPEIDVELERLAAQLNELPAADPATIGDNQP